MTGGSFHHFSTRAAPLGSNIAKVMPCQEGLKDQHTPPSLALWFCCEENAKGPRLLGYGFNLIEQTGSSLSCRAVLREGNFLTGLTRDRANSQ